MTGKLIEPMIEIVRTDCEQKTKKLTSQVKLPFLKTDCLRINKRLVSGELLSNDRKRLAWLVPSWCSGMPAIGEWGMKRKEEGVTEGGGGSNLDKEPSFTS